MILKYFTSKWNFGCSIGLHIYNCLANLITNYFIHKYNIDLIKSIFIVEHRTCSTGSLESKLYRDLYQTIIIVCILMSQASLESTSGKHYSKLLPPSFVSSVKLSETKN